MSKGFIKILEAVIAAVILISSMSYFFSLEIKSSHWPQALLETYGKDMLITMDKSGYLGNFISDNNFSESSGMLQVFNRMKSNTMGVSIWMENIPKPNIRLGCPYGYCKPDDIKKMIYSDKNESNITLNSRKINFSLDSESGMHNLLTKGDVDIIIILGYQNLSNLSSDIESYLGSGNSLFMLGDLNQGSSDNYTDSLFGIEWKSGTPSRENNFSYLSNISKSVANYFAFTSARAFTNTLLANGERNGTFFLQNQNYEIHAGNYSSKNMTRKPSPCYNYSIPEPNGYGDVNGDGIVNATDLSIINSGSCSSFGANSCERADVDNNGAVDFNDNASVIKYLNGTNSSFAVCSFPAIANNTDPYYVNFSSAVSFKGENFSAGSAVIKILKIDNDISDGNTYLDLMITNKSFSFNLSNTSGYNNISKNAYTIVSSTNDFSASQARKGIINRNGRAAWIKNYSSDYTDDNQLATAIMLWLSSGKYNLDKNLGKTISIPSYYTTVSYVVYGKENPEPYMLSIALWYIF